MAFASDLFKSFTWKGLFFDLDYLQSKNFPGGNVQQQENPRWTGMSNQT